MKHFKSALPRLLQFFSPAMLPLLWSERLEWISFPPLGIWTEIIMLSCCQRWFYLLICWRWWRDKWTLNNYLETLDGFLVHSRRCRELLSLLQWENWEGQERFVYFSRSWALLKNICMCIHRLKGRKVLWRDTKWFQNLSLWWAVLITYCLLISEILKDDHQYGTGFENLRKTPTRNQYLFMSNLQTKINLVIFRKTVINLHLDERKYWLRWKQLNNNLWL